MKKEDFFKGISNTFFEEIFMLQEEDLVPPDEEIKLSESIIDKMNKLEKNIYSLLYKKTKELTEKMEEAESHLSMGLKINKLDSYKLNVQIELLRNLMWVIIQDRFDVYTENLGVRKDFTIVSYEKDEDCENCGACEKYSHQNNQMRGISMN